MVRTVAGRSARDRRRGSGIFMVTVMAMPIAEVAEAAVISVTVVILVPVLVLVAMAPVQVRVSRPEMTISSARSDIGMNRR